jgi:hypothetical protein
MVGIHAVGERTPLSQRAERWRTCSRRSDPAHSVQRGSTSGHGSSGRTRRPIDNTCCSGLPNRSICTAPTCGPSNTAPGRADIGGADRASGDSSSSRLHRAGMTSLRHPPP